MMSYLYISLYLLIPWSIPRLIYGYVYCVTPSACYSFGHLFICFVETRFCYVAEIGLEPILPQLIRLPGLFVVYLHPKLLCAQSQVYSHWVLLSLQDHSLLLPTACSGLPHGHIIWGFQLVIKAFPSSVLCISFCVVGATSLKHFQKLSLLPLLCFTLGTSWWCDKIIHGSSTFSTFFHWFLKT